MFQAIHRPYKLQPDLSPQQQANILIHKEQELQTSPMEIPMFTIPAGLQGRILNPTFYNINTGVFYNSSL